MSNFKLMQGDCLELMQSIPDGSVDMVLTDPPYGTIKGLWKNTEWDNTLDNHKMFEQCNKLARTNAAVALFSQEPYTSHLITNSHSNLPFSYRMTWLKDTFANHLSSKKAPLSYTEDICVFFKAYDDLGNNPLRKYAKQVFDFIGKTRKQISQDMKQEGLKPQVLSHFFCSDSATQFGLPTKNTYEAMIKLYKIDKMQGFLTYNQLFVKNERYRRVFNLPEGQKYKSNVLEYRKDYGGHHPTQKPVALLEDLIRTYTKEGDTVLDFTMGSGSTGVACANLGRSFIGIELDPDYFYIAQSRINEAKGKLL